MKEPKIHSTLHPMLPAGHWLVDAGVLHCKDAEHEVVYDPDAGGTQRTWVETGRITLEGWRAEHMANRWEPGVYCIWHFAGRENDVTLQMAGKFLLEDDDGPQPEERNYAPETADVIGEIPEVPPRWRRRRKS